VSKEIGKYLNSINSLFSRLIQTDSDFARIRLPLDPGPAHGGYDILRFYTDPPKLITLHAVQGAVIQATEARLVNPLTSTSLTSRSRVISTLGRYNRKCSVVQNRDV
jgi:hypothetical protein